ncbi:MAG: tRNA lysidine(34) synthetase TilS [bacterium]|nr:tRNA lysidine(34) synthetase TilS [bacterium]
MAVPGGLSQFGNEVCAAVARLPAGPVVVAISGGADSAVAAWACHTVRPQGRVRAVHVNHGWAASDRLQQAAVAIAEKLSVPLEIAAVTPEEGPSPEGAAREVRLAALVAAAGGDLIVMGHHADDAAETVVGNLLRGAGATGLAGITPERLPFVRPLIGFRRQDLRDLATELELPFLDDPSNDDREIRRNVIRHDILPELDSHIDGELVEIVGRSAQHLAADDAYLDEVTPPDIAVVDGDTTLLAVAPLVTVPAVLAKRAIRAALRKVHPPYPGTTREVEAILAVTLGSTPRRDLGGGYVVEKEGPYVAIHKPEEPIIPEPIELTVPSRVVFGSHIVTVMPVTTGTRTHMSHDWCRLALPSGRLAVRAPQRGDRIDIGTGSKKVADALNEAGIAVRRRPAWPLVESRGRIAWVAGVRVAAWARVETSLSTWIEFERQTT